MWVDFVSDLNSRDVSTGATGMTAVASEFSDTLTLSPPGGANSAHQVTSKFSPW